MTYCFTVMTINSGLFFFITFISFHFVASIFLDSSEDIASSDRDSDAFLDSFGLLTKYGYTPEKNSVTTEDGYIVTLFRIPRKGPAVLLAHGVTDSSDEWLMLGPNRSLAYQLADAGFDVWLFNSRGNRYSKGHKRNISNEIYWDFSYEEVGTRDLPATIDHILKTTSREKITYIGFSQGTAVFFVMCSMRPGYNNKIEQAFLLAPVAWVSNVKFPLMPLLSQNVEFISSLSKTLELYEVFPFSPKKVYTILNCYRTYPRQFCDIEYFVNFGLKNSSYFPFDRAAVISSHIPAGVSAKTFIHYMQSYKSKRFQRFDYGETKNVEMYSTKIPPVYDVSLVTAPVNILASEIDWFSAPDDVKMLTQYLPNIRSFSMFNESLEFSHLEFVFGTRANSLVNKNVINMLIEGSK